MQKRYEIKILYIEDEETIREPVSSALKLLYDTVTATNGEEGFELFKKTPFFYDLIITDINMPKMNGLELSKRIKSLNAAVPIIITSAFDDKEYLIKAIEIGINHYMIKPLDIMKLIEIIEKVLEPILLKREKIKNELEYQEKLVEQARFAAIGQLSAGITHEINTPLTYMKSSFELIEMEVEDISETKIREHIKEDLEIIKNGFARIENIIYSMKESFNSNNKSKHLFNIYDTLIVALNMAYNKSKHISNIYINNKLFNFKTIKEKEDFLTFINVPSIEQVWIIIINNALDELTKIKSFDERKLEIFITKDEKKIYVKFVDNAGGIKEDIIKKIFEPFKSSKESSGIGIGLNIANKIILSHDGEIKAYNENNGAVFEIILPIVYSEI